MLRAMALGVGNGVEFAGQLITGEEGLALLTGHLNRSKCIAGRLMRASRLARSTSGPAPSVVVESIPRPNRTLRLMNRGRVLPGLLKEAVNVVTASSIMEAVGTVHELTDAGMSLHVVLDFFIRAAGLPARIAVDVLRKRGIPMTLSTGEVEAVGRAREFWDQYLSGRAAFASAVAAMETPPLAGDWAIFESSELTTLLPGLTVPHLLRRRAYSVNLVSIGNGLCLDLHAFPSGLPLIRHPLRG